MAGGGVVSDVCLLFERKCQSFDLATRDNRPEIQYHHWYSQHDDWPITGKADLIFFDPPYHIKKEKAYGEKANEKVPSISSYSKERYEESIESFFILACRNIKQTTRMAFLNADWRDFESTPALKENPDKSITIFDYHRLLSKTGWEVTHLPYLSPHHRSAWRQGVYHRFPPCGYYGENAKTIGRCDQRSEWPTRRSRNIPDDSVDSAGQQWRAFVEHEG